MERFALATGTHPYERLENPDAGLWQYVQHALDGPVYEVTITARKVG